MKNNNFLIDLRLTTPITCSVSHWDSDYVIDSHYHNNDQLIYAAKGSISVNTKDGVWVVPSIRAVWVPAKTAHSVNISAGTELITLQFSEELTPQPRNKCRVLQVSALLREGVLRSANWPSEYNDTSPEAHIAAVILDEIRSAERIATLHLPIPMDSRARKIALKIKADPSIRLSLHSWAEKSGASERTLARLFQSETGMSFGKWKQQARLLKALQFLALGKPVTTVALEVGFRSSSAFITMFRSALGCTPTQYFSSPNNIRS